MSAKPYSENRAERYQLDADEPSYLRQWLGARDACGLELEYTPEVNQLLAFARRAELRLSERDVHSRGAVYTPPALALRITARSLDELERNSDRPPVVFDPACGGGVFVAAAAQELSSRLGLPLETVFSKHIVAADLNEQAVLATRALVEFALLSDSVSSERAQEIARSRVFMADFLDAPSPDLPVTPNIFVGNPPYLKIQNISPADRERYASRYGEIARGNYSTTLLFIAETLERLPSDGVAGYVAQNNLFTSLAARSLRDVLVDRRALRRIVNFGERQFFDGASAYTCLLYIASAPQDSFEYCDEQIPGLPPETSRIQTSTLSAKKWRLAPARHLRNLHRIEAADVSLGDTMDIRVGFATLKDKVFFARQRDDGEVIAVGPDGREHRLEKGSTLPAIRIADFASEAELEENTRRIIYPYALDSAKPRAIPWDEWHERFPRASSYLEEWRAVLLKRAKGRLPLEDWYLFGRNQSLRAPGPKLLTKTFARRPSFMLDASDALFCNGYSLTVSERGRNLGWTLLALQRVLNSKMMEYYARLTSFSISGGYQCYQKNFIVSFGLPSLEPHEASQIEAADEDHIAHLYAERLGVDSGLVDAYLARARTKP